VVHKLLDITVDKTLQFSDWLQRPIGEMQLKYALNDVKHLRQIYLHLLEILKCNGRLSWVQEEMQEFYNEKLYNIDVENLWKKFVSPNLRAKNLGVLRELCIWRDSLAREKNVPASRILKDVTLTRIAEKMPKKAEHLEYAPKEYVEIILGLVENAKELHFTGNKPHLSVAESELISTLRIILKHQAKLYKLPEYIIANKDHLNMIIQDDYQLSGWRYEVFGKIAKDFQNGEVSLSYFNGIVLH
jgi:ribonuclease D